MPGFPAPVDQVFQFIQQLLGPADAEGGDDHGAVVFQGVLDGGFEFEAPVLSAFVGAVTVGAFDDQSVGFVG